MAGLDDLAAHSLVRLMAGTEEAAEPRLAMLESIHAFAQDRLQTAGEADAIRERHAAYTLALVEALDAAVVVFLPDGHVSLDRLEAELPNIRLALTHFAETGNGEAMLRLAGALDYFWQVRGGVPEGLSWLERALELGHHASPRARATGLLAIAGALRTHGEPARALPLCRESLELASREGHGRGVALAAQRASLLARQQGAFAEAIDYEAQATAALDAMPGEPWAARAASTILGHVPLGQGDLAGAERQFEEAITRQRALGHEPGSSHPYACFPLIGLGDVARGRGEPATALGHYQRGLRHAWAFGETPPIVYALGGVAGSLAAAGQWERAARLFGATQAMCERAGLPFGPAALDRQRALGLPEPWQQAGESFGLDAPLRAALAGQATTLARVPDPGAGEQHWAAGRLLPAAEAVAEALAVDSESLDESAPPTSPESGRVESEARIDPVSSVGGDLTRREREIVALLCQRYTDPEIAEALFISPYTASKHVSNVLGKLGAANRREAASIAVRHGLV
jgi:DNA-binding CsgD family transcriptional regulator